MVLSHLSPPCHKVGETSDTQGLSNKALIHWLASPVSLLLTACCVSQEKGFDPVYGARPVKRAVQRELETALAKALLRGEFGEDDTVIVDAPGGAKSEGLVLTRVEGSHKNNGASGSFSSMDEPGSALPIEVQGSMG